MYEEFIGKRVILRSNNAGVFTGILEEVNGETARLSKCRNIWKWEGAACLMQASVDGIRGGKVSQEVDTILLMGVCEILPLSEIACLSIDRIPVWKL